MLIFFPSREQARKASFGRMIDMGNEAPKGCRFARTTPNFSGNAHQRKIALKRFIRGVGV